MEPMLKVVATLCAAFFSGGALYISVVQHPALMADMAAATSQFRNMYRRAARWQASNALICLLAAVLIALFTAQWWWAIGGLLVGASVPFTGLVIMPTNARLLDESAQLTPDEVFSLLKYWGTLHWCRSILSTLGLLVLVAKAGP
ncbi:MAG TPA: DUF1772 domain-containing protein [Candidatus Binataceae bacterium]|nr:DUF1772 domain-containing protein [Candidatus Binataceae bacterium]